MEEPGGKYYIALPALSWCIRYRHYNSLGWSLARFKICSYFPPLTLQGGTLIRDTQSADSASVTVHGGFGAALATYLGEELLL